MIELTKEKDVYEVSVSAKIGVARTIRVTARGAMHAREVAVKAVKEDFGPNDWVFPPTGQIVTLQGTVVADASAGVPTKIEPDAYDKNGMALFIGDDIKYNRAVEGVAKVRIATINEVATEGDRKTIWCDGNLFSMRPEDVTKA
jgi:hypothetical protein